MDISFSALVKIPSDRYFAFNAAIDGVAAVDSITRDDDTYHANIDFGMNNLMQCIEIVSTCEGSIVEIIQTDKLHNITPKVAKAVSKYIGNKKKRATTAIKTGSLADHMKTWKTAAELMKEAKISSPTFYYRLSKLKRANRLQTKGTAGSTQYRIKSAA
jgi:predicted HTH transcriptional regulator